jgi:enamine deaminase RidA (YjgF/YER057c/UK114 family)
MERLHINPKELKNSQKIGYNHAVIADGEFYMSGQVAMDADGEIVGDDITTQAKKTYENLGILLETVGKDFSDIAKVTTHILEPYERYYNGYKQVYWETFDKPYPCHTVLGTHQLAQKDYLIEVEVEVPFCDEDMAMIEPDGDEIVEIS